MGEQTELWGWFLFKSRLPPQRAKGLLIAWQHQGLSLPQALDRLPGGAGALGVTPDEAGHLKPPRPLPEMPPALTWDDVLYPDGLKALPANRRPALLFYRGEAALLARPIVTLIPSPEGASPDETTQEMAREVISLLLGEPILLGVYEGSVQHALVMEEMAYSEGEALLFTRAGLDARDPPERERTLVDAARLLVISPLPPDAAYRPAWDPVLRQVAAAAADRCILTDATGPQAEGISQKPALWLAPEPTARPLPSNVAALSRAEISDVLLWIDNLLGTRSASTETSNSSPKHNTSKDTRAPGGYGHDVDARPLGDAIDLGPAPTTGEIIDTLEKGGEIPEVLLQRLRDNKGRR